MNPIPNNPIYLTNPATPAAQQWAGWGTALKPAWEPIIVARKPLQGTVAANVQQYGTGAINVDGCRVGTDERTYSMSGAPGGNWQRLHGGDGRDVENALRYAEESKTKPDVTVSGRWPANLIHDGSAEVLAGFPSSMSNGGTKGGNPGAIYANGNGIPHPSYFNYGDTGSAARFFYCAKASKADRDEGCEGLELRGGTFGQRRCAKCGCQAVNVSGTCQCDEPEWIEGDEIKKVRNHHPTVKPTALMRYLCKLVTPPGGVILDPFMGSGSTGKAAMLEGFGFIGCEIDAGYFAIAEKRIAAAAAQPALFQLDAPKVEYTQEAMI